MKQRGGVKGEGERGGGREVVKETQRKIRDNAYIFHDLEFLQVCSFCIHKFSDVFLSLYFIPLHALE